MEGARRNPVAGQSAADLKLQIEAERDGRPFVVHRSAAGELQLDALDAERVTLGRDPANDIAIDDEQVSRVHAELELIGGAWIVSDQGLSTNGTYVNGERIAGRTRLADRDLIEVGSTGVEFRLPTPSGAPGPTVAADSTETALALRTPSGGC
ncbi:MAG: FHA domain-containing protein [Solirubrobacterales bacterium]